MKVTYTQNRFEIDGVEIINPEVLPRFKGLAWLYNGIEPQDLSCFNLPDNIIAEKMDRCKVCGAFENENCKGSYYGCDVSNVTVYRLKLKEPLSEYKEKLNRVFEDALDDMKNTKLINAHNNASLFSLNDIKKLIESL